MMKWRVILMPRTRFDVAAGISAVVELDETTRDAEPQVRTRLTGEETRRECQAARESGVTWLLVSSLSPFMFCWPST